MPKTRTHEQWISDACAAREDANEYIWLSKYENTDIHIKYRHICGKEHQIKPYKFLQGRGCPDCARKKQLTTYKERYGKGTIGCKEVDAKRRKSMIEKYGVDHPQKSDEIKNKAKDTWDARTDEETNHINNKRKETMRERFGRDNVKQSHIDIKYAEIFRTKETIETYLKSFSDKPKLIELQEITGYNFHTISKKINDYNLNHLIYYGTKTKQHRDIIREFPELCKSERTILNGLELDCFYREMMLGVELNGYYYHSTCIPEKDKSNIKRNSKSKDYHDIKTKMAESKGVRLIHLWDYEWETKKQQCIYLLKSALGKFNEIHEKDTEIKEVDVFKYSMFMNKYHIYGDATATVRIGLYYNGFPVMMMGFRKEHNDDSSWNLVRISNNINVIGGENKIIKYFLQNYEIGNGIVAFCDTGKFIGKPYVDMGFSKVGELSPRYVWVKPKSLKLGTYDIKSKRACMHEFRNKENDNMGEIEVMTGIGYYQCYGSHIDKYRR